MTGRLNSSGHGMRAGGANSRMTLATGEPSNCPRRWLMGSRRHSASGGSPRPRCRGRPAMARSLCSFFTARRDRAATSRTPAAGHGLLPAAAGVRPARLWHSHGRCRGPLGCSIAIDRRRRSTASSGSGSIAQQYTNGCSVAARGWLTARRREPLSTGAPCPLRASPPCGPPAAVIATSHCAGR